MKKLDHFASDLAVSENEVTLLCISIHPTCINIFKRLQIVGRYARSIFIGTPCIPTKSAKGSFFQENHVPVSSLSYLVS